ncbi:MAG: hypothetical protein IKF72_11300 [Kiritimatiellae bacterium]|nr:hypothetical protein [Kiritimatiellia bacterium]
MAINLTLNDFRSVLGNVNDGNIVLKQDQSGIEKANYGNKFLNLFRTVRTAPNNPEENMQVRQALLAAIQNSVEGEVLSLDDMQRIYSALGMPESGPDANSFMAPLTRRDLQNVIDIIDGATKNDALIAKNESKLSSQGVLDKSAANAVKTAMNSASCFQIPAKGKERVAQARQLFGADFKGRSPAELEKFVRQNMALIREQVFDKLYWTNPSLKDFSIPDNLDELYVEPDGNDLEPVAEETVVAAFKETVGELMEKFAAKETIVSRADTLAPKTEKVQLQDDDAASIWKTVGGAKLEANVNAVFSALAEGSGVFAAEQLGRAATVVKNHIVETFNNLCTANKSNTQNTEKAFNAAIAPLKNMLDSFVADLERIGPQAAAGIKAKLADALGAQVIEKNIGTHFNKSALFDGAMRAFASVSKGFSARSLVEDFVNANLPYANDKSQVVEFFMGKISAAGKEEGIGEMQAKALADAQRLAAGGKLEAADKRTLENQLLNPLKEAYDKMVADQDPEKIRELRNQRNAAAFDKLLAAMPGSAQMDDANKSSAILRLKLDTLIAKFDYDTLFKKGILNSPGSTQIKKGKDGAPDPDALAKLENELLDMSDNDLEFYSHYSAKGFSKADFEIGMLCQGQNLGDNHGTHFKDALRDGTIRISDIPKNAVPVLKGLVFTPILDSLQKNDLGSSLRELLPEEHQSSSLATDLQTRLREGFQKSGAGTLPKCFKECMKKDANNNLVPDNNEAGRQLASTSFSSPVRIRGFGTSDPARILNLFSSMGIDLAPLDGTDDKAKVDIYEKIYCLSMISAMSGHKLDGLAEFTERVFGKPFQDVTAADVFKVLAKNKILEDGKLGSSLVVKDPIDDLATDRMKNAKQFLAGEIAISEAKLMSWEAAELLEAARAFAAGAQSKTVSISTIPVEMKRVAGGGLSVKIDNRFPMRAAFDVQGFVRLLENEITSKPKSFDKKVVTSALPSLDDVKSGAVSLARARELYAKTAAAMTGTLPVMFSAYTTAELRDIAVKAVNGEFKAGDIAKEPPATYNSGAMIEMHDNLSKTSSAEVDACVKIATTVPKPIDERRAVAPDGATVRNIVADLFLNNDTWAFDAGAAGKAQPGERVRKLIVEYGPELDFILKGLDSKEDDLLSNLPQNVRDAVRDVFADIKKLDISRLANANQLPEGARAALDAIEKKIDGVANSLAESMQAKVTALFEPHGSGEVKQDWQKTFAELNGKEGIDETTRQGKFTMNVLRNYFKSAAPVDKRAMLSAFIRNTEAGATDAKQVAELLKGAGPLLQKMLQGLPLSSFDKDTQLALKDMKSRLLPIPEEAVKAQMLELVRSSNGNILSIEVKRSLGAASVGQAFLCNVKTKAHPNIGEECVIKLLRPNVDTAVQREKAMIDQIIGDDPAMKATFDGQYRKILEEFDLTLESTNVGVGQTVYEMPKNASYVHSMQMLEGTQPTTTSMIIKKADGQTFDNLIESTRSSAEEILAPLRKETEIDGVKKTVYKAPDAKTMGLARRRLVLKAAELNDRRNQILGVASTWFDNALFGNGFFHGDLHGGNLMTGPSGTTFIDFGNCSRFSSQEQTTMQMMLACVVSGDADRVIGKFKALMPEDAVRIFDQKFPVGSDARNRLEAVLKRGTSLDLMSRVQAFISIVQGEDVPVPAPLQNFVQSYVRLADIVADIDRTVEDLEIAAASIYCDLPETGNVENESRAITLMKNFAKAYIGDANTPCSIESVRAAAREFQTYANSAEGKAEIHALTHDIGRIRNELMPLLELLRCTQAYTRFDNDIILSNVNMPAGFRYIRNDLDAIAELDKAGKIQDGKIVSDIEKEMKLFDDLEEHFLDGAYGSIPELTRAMSTAHDGESTFTGLAVKVDKSVTDVCVDVISSYQDKLKPAALKEFINPFAAIGFGNRLSSAFEAGEVMAHRMKHVGPALSERNRNLPPGERLSGQEMATLSRATSTFLVPSPRPDADVDWAASKEKRADMLAAISYNLSRAAEAMKLKPGESLSASAVSFSALNMGLIDAELVESIAGMDEDDYNTLVTEAQQLDAKTGGNELATALDALRGANDLLVQVSPVEEEE